MYAKKSLGQNFLTSKAIVADMVTASGVKQGDRVLEVGPGKGALTGALLAAGAQVTAVEKDGYLAEKLAVSFDSFISGGKLRIVPADILSCDLKENGFNARDFSIIANIPYYITGEFLRKMLSGDVQPASMTLLLQREVARRIATEVPGSILSMSVRAFGDPKYVKTVQARHFQPKPKVDSAILHIGGISRERLAGLDEAIFFAIVKTGFSQKRKKLTNNLSLLYTKAAIEAACTDCEIILGARAEELTFANLVCLTKKLSA
jgi:16S rRNA (adenine1518-N6/adenine1519-N6)-dimethyltransferase